MLRQYKYSFIFLFAFFLFFNSAYAQSFRELFQQAGDPVVGNASSGVTVVEFFDYQCSHCSAMSSIIQNVIKTNPNVRFVFKELPIRGGLSELASRAALAAENQGKYYQLHHALMEASPPLTEEEVFDLAKKLGLNVNQLKSDMNSTSIANKINTNLRLAHSLQLAGTPAFYIGKTNAVSTEEVQFVLGEMTQSELQLAINKAKKQ